MSAIEPLAVRRYNRPAHRNRLLLKMPIRSAIRFACLGYPFPHEDYDLFVTYLIAELRSQFPAALWLRVVHRRRRLSFPVVRPSIPLRHGSSRPATPRTRARADLDSDPYVARHLTNPAFPRRHPCAFSHLLRSDC